VGRWGEVENGGGKEVVLNQNKHQIPNISVRGCIKIEKKSGVNMGG
jgi:hypothetical protein